MLAQDVHAILRAVLGPEMKRLGFRRLSGSTAGWYREESSRYLLVYAYTSWTGFDEEFGNWFALEFAYATEPKKSAISSADRRHSELLTPTQRADIARIENQARIVIPALQPNGEYSGMLTYYYPEHVREYALILTGAMEAMLEALH